MQLAFELIAQLCSALGCGVAADDLAVEVAEGLSNDGSDSDEGDEDEGVDDGVNEVWEGRVKVEN